MHLYRLPAPRAAATLVAVISVAASLAAQSKTPANLSNVRVENFGKINDQYYRGAQPDEAGYDDLAALGIRTVIDLTRDGRSDEPALVEHSGMRFYWIPLTTTDRPAEEAIARFLQIVNDPANQPVYVHCEGGRHRTGAMTAVYRMTENGWTADRAYAEMRQFNFAGFPHHPVLKHFVYDYYAQLSRSREVAPQSVPASTVAQK